MRWFIVTIWSSYPEDSGGSLSGMLTSLLADARAAAHVLRTSSTQQRDAALEAIADAIEEDAPAILKANQEDVAKATDLSPALTDRLHLTPKRIDALVRAVQEIRALPDPLGSERPMNPGRSGIRIARRRVPLGVVAIVYESRPNVTVECAALCLKSGNAAILRGGKEARQSNAALMRSVQIGIESAGLPGASVQAMLDSTREDVHALLGATGHVDLVIPRGGHGLMNMVDAQARVPVIRHGQGICHVYLAAGANAERAVRIAYDAKVDRPGVCNSMETLVVHDSQQELISRLGPLLTDAGVSIRADPPAKATLEAVGVPVAAAEDKDWDTEFLGPVLAIRTVASLDEAIEFITRHGTHHTASIVTEDASEAERFLAAVDASCVLWNASTRFNDGGELGLGAEMGISTSKMHAYGPMSVTELTAEKHVVYGDGHIRGTGP